MAFSHSCTLGPRMKCWDSITSAMAVSTSDLMRRYCALRSNNGTSMDLLIPFSIPCTTQCPCSILRAAALLHPDQDIAGFRFQPLFTDSRFQDTESRPPSRVNLVG